MRSFRALLASAVGGILLLAYHWQKLPDRLASHFNASGTADGWMSKDAHFIFAAGLIVLMTAMFIGIAVLVQKLDQRWINIPNKEHWFSDKLQGQTRLGLSAWSYTYGAMMNVFLIFVFHLVYLANTSEPAQLDNTAMFSALLVFIGLSIGSVIMLVVRYGDTGKAGKI